MEKKCTTTLPREALSQFQSVLRQEFPQAFAPEVAAMRAQRLRQQVMFSIEPVPLKMGFEFRQDEESENVAFIGNEHEVIVEFQPDSDISLTSLKMHVENVDFESLTQVNQIPDVTLAQSVNLSQSEDGGGLTRENSMVFVRAAAGGQRELKQITVMRSSSKRASMHQKETNPWMANHPFSRQKTYLKDVEIFYEKQGGSGELVELDYNSADNNAVTLDPSSRQAKLIFKFYQEAANSINLWFSYQFVQNIASAGANSTTQEMQQVFKKTLVVKSVAPLAVEWTVKNANPFLANLKRHAENKGQQWEMVVPRAEKSWLTCNLVSKSQKKPISISQIDLDIIERRQIRKLQQIGLNTQQPTLLDQFDSQNQTSIQSEALCLNPTESCICSFQIEPLELSDNDAFPGSKSQDQNSASVSASSNVNQGGSSNRVTELEQFGELLISWQTTKANASQAGEPELGELVQFSIAVPPLQVIDVPLKVRELESSVRTKKMVLNEAITLEYEVVNQSEEVFECTVSVDENEDFYIGGELRSFVGIMPSESYIFRYNVIPLNIGRLSFPCFNITEKESQVPFIKGFTRKCLVTK